MRACIFALVSVFASSQLLAVSLDQMMTPAEKEKTGYASLTATQRQALDTWVGQHFVAKNPNAQGVKKENSNIEYSKLSLSLNVDNGQKLILSDNSEWEVSPDDVGTASLWLSPVIIQIMPSDDPIYTQRI
jgi:hypothetical protein